MKAAWLVAVLALTACEKTAAPTSRSEQILATGDGSLGSPPGPPLADLHSADAARPRRKLCPGDGNARGRILPRVALSHVEAPGAAHLDGALPAANGAWTWINFWAAWCGPCKEEIPRLLGWQDRLTRGGAPLHLVFVSVDDDGRQLEQFLGQQPPEGLRASLWLPDGPLRATWLSSMRMKSSPELPEQALIDPEGHVRCFIEGAVEDPDYAETAALLGASFGASFGH